MKKLSAVITIAMVLCSLSACTSKTYEDGYANGYSDAEYEVSYLTEEKFFDGYETGYDEGYEEVYNAILDATDYARERTGWSVYEAWNNISIYQDGVHPYGYELPTEEEYLQSIETLVLFCEYLDNAGLGE